MRLGAGDVTEPYAIENSWTMRVEDTISTLQRLRGGNGDIWKTGVEKGKREERAEESSFISGYFMLSSIERERRLLDEKHGKWIARRMEMITKETKERFQGEMEVEYRVNKQVVKKPATKSPEEIQQMLCWEQYVMEMLLLYEVNGWEELFWNKFNVFLEQIGNDRAEVKERLTREWRANCWKRLNPQMHAAEKRAADFNINNWFTSPRQSVQRKWASSIGQFFDGVDSEISNSISLLREWIQLQDDEMRLRMENEIEDIEYRLKRGSDLERFDQFWDDDTLFQCRYSRSKWLYLRLHSSTVPHEIYSHYLSGKKNFIHITFGGSDFDVNWLQDTIRDLPWVTSISCDSSGLLPAFHRDLLYIKSTNNDLIQFAEEIRFKVNPFKIQDSTYIFTEAGRSDMYSGELGNNARVLISFVAPTSGQRLILRLKHSGKEDGPLEVTLGSTKIQLNPSYKWLFAQVLTIDDITLYPIPGPSGSDHLSFEAGIRNDIVIRFKGTFESGWGHDHRLHDIELLDETGLKYMSHSASLSV